jgi:predicted metal-binding protein
MKEEKMKSYVELHVCNYKREDDECCFDKGSKDLTDKLKKWAKEEHGKEIRVFRSGCLGKCSEGIAMALYPEKKFILEAKEKDHKEIKEGLEEALRKAKKTEN